MTTRSGAIYQGRIAPVKAVIDKTAFDETTFDKVQSKTDFNKAWPYYHAQSCIQFIPPPDCYKNLTHTYVKAKTETLPFPGMDDNFKCDSATTFHKVVQREMSMPPPNKKMTPSERIALTSTKFCSLYKIVVANYSILKTKPNLHYIFHRRLKKAIPYVNNISRDTLIQYEKVLSRGMPLPITIPKPSKCGHFGWSCFKDVHKGPSVI